MQLGHMCALLGTSHAQNLQISVSSSEICCSPKASKMIESDLWICLMTQSHGLSPHVNGLKIRNVKDFFEVEVLGKLIFCPLQI
jgi:hypothetical protein